MVEEKIRKTIEDTKASKLSQDLVFDGGFIKVFKEKYKLPDGKIIEKQRVSKNNDKEAAIVITRTSDDKYVMVFQNRVDSNVSIEFPSGYIEDNEDVLEASKREVEEETGFITSNQSNVKLLDSFIPNIGTENTKIHLVYIDNVSKGKEQSLDDDEFINYSLFTFDELDYLVKNNYIQSGGNKLAFYHLKDILNDENK